jgi:hypothetical protein
VATEGPYATATCPTGRSHNREIELIIKVSEVKRAIPNFRNPVVRDVLTALALAADGRGLVELAELDEQLSKENRSNWLQRLHDVMLGASGGCQPQTYTSGFWVQAVGPDADRVCRVLRTLDFYKRLNVWTGPNYVEATFK